MAVKRTGKKAAKDPKWTWGYDNFNNQEEVEEAIAEAIFEQVLDDDEELSDPTGAAWDVEVTVTLVPHNQAGSC